MRRSFLSLLILFGVAVPVAAVVVEDAAVESELRAMYSLDYAEASASALRRIEKDPEDPFAYLVDAGVLYWRASAEPGIFKSSAPLAARLDEDLAAALRLSKARLRDPDDGVRADAYFVHGLSLGIRAQWQLTRGRWFRAYLDGRKGAKFLKKCLAIDPAYADAYLGMGLYEYLSDTLPGVLKLGAFLLVHGSASRGLEYLRSAERDGRYRFAATQASSNLVMLNMVYGTDDAAAAKHLRRLLAAYPDSPYFRFLEVLLLARAGDFEASRTKALELYARAERDPKLLLEKRASMLCGAAPDRCLNPETLSAAVAWLDRAIADPRETPAGWKTLCRLLRGAALDVLGKREAATEDFRAVLAGPGVADSHAWAGRCLKEPCREADARVLLERRY